MILLRALGNAVIESPKRRIFASHTVVFAACLYMILERKRKITRESLETLLWPDLQNSAKAHHRFRQTLHIMKQLGVPIIRDKTFLRIGCESETDFDAFLSQAADEELPAIPESFQFLPDYAPRLSTNFSHWLDGKRRYVSAGLIRLLLAHIRSDRNRGNWAKVEQLSNTCIEVDEFNEEAILARAESIAMRGGKLEALAVLDKYIKDLGTASSDVRIPACVMRKRISERRDLIAYESTPHPFIGRDNELSFLNSGFKQADDSHGSICVIEGMTGMGKSRLAREFGDFAKLKGIEVRTTRCQPTDRNRPLSAFVDIVPPLQKMRGAIGCSPETIDALSRLTLNDSTRHLSNPTTDPETIAHQLQTAILDLLDAVSEEKTLVFLVDDAHWLDNASLVLFEALAVWAKSHRILFVLFARGSAHKRSLIASLNHVSYRRLEPLSEAQSHIIILGLLKQHGTSASDVTLNWFTQVGEGNPYFLLELVGQWVKSGHRAEPPPSLAAILDQRLSTLSTASIRMLQTTALLGKHATLERLERILKYRSFEFLDCLNELGQAGLLRTELHSGSITAEPGITCTHDFIATTVSNLLSPPALMALHRIVASDLEREIEEAQFTSLAWDAADHWAGAGDAAHALRLTLKCASHLLAIGFPCEAVLTYRRALSFCRTTPEKVAVLVDLAETLHTVGEWKEVDIAISEVKRIQSQDLSQCSDHCDLELLQFEARWRSSAEWTGLFASIKSCIFSTNASAEHRIRAAVLGLKLATNIGGGEELDLIYESVEPLLEQCKEAGGAALQLEMVYHIDRGDMIRGRSAAVDLVEYERSHGNSISLMWALVNAAQAMRRCGEYGSSMRLLQDAFDISISQQLRTRAGIIAHHAILTALAFDDLSVASKWYNLAIDNPGPHEDQHSRDELSYYGARIALANGNLEDAKKLFHQIVSVGDESLLHQISHLSLATRLAIVFNENPERVRELVKQLTSLYEIERSRGGQDFEAYSLYLGHTYIGNPVAARNLLNDYVRSYRRELGTLPLEVVTVIRNHAKTGVRADTIGGTEAF